MNARFVSALAENKLRCELCPRRCVTAPGAAGLCRVRKNRGGGAALPYAGRLTAFAVDPVEKKPLYHYRPGTSIVSAGFAGCNLRCPFCQNWHISQSMSEAGQYVSPADLVTAALREADGGSAQIAYTYSEPLVHIEYLLACMEEARKRGAANVLVTNGCVNDEAAAEVLALTDAANVDLKCFTADGYAKTLGGDLETVKAFIARAVSAGVHTEVTTLIVPGFNDSDGDLAAAADFIAGLAAGHAVEIPWHLSAYHPAWKYDAPPTPPAAVLHAAKQASRKLRYVYTGNIAGSRFSDTACPHCGKTLVSRNGYRVDTSGLALKNARYTCARCGEAAPFTW